MGDNCGAIFFLAAFLQSSPLDPSRRLPEHVSNPLHNLIGLRNDLMVPESQHRVSLADKKRSAPFVAVGFVGVLRTVDLDNQPRFQAEEVCEKRSDRLLSAEPESFEL
ncbi:MAG TPA: hypothetical protein VE243_11120 [Candidatus Acidoferrum sp.]|nr:hypothetical protein [Candidatus Acidoferrum sp.]